MKENRRWLLAEEKKEGVGDARDGYIILIHELVTRAATHLCQAWGLPLVGI